MPLQRVGRTQDGVIAALHHARAAALSDESLDDDDDLQPGIDVVCVHGRQQPGAAGAEDEDVRVQRVDVHRRLKAVMPTHAQTTPMSTSPTVMTLTVPLPRRPQSRMMLRRPLSP